MKGGDAEMKNKVFIFKWLITIFAWLIAVIIGAIGFIISCVEMGIVFSLFGVAIIAWYIAFVPHSFLLMTKKLRSFIFLDIKSLSILI